jgi:glycosyltransferase involved in cell wall biosynthesis
MEPTVLHIFSGDLWAGAEVMIHNLLAQLHLDNQVRLIALSMNEGVLTGKLRAVGIETHVIPEAQLSFPSILLRAAWLLRSRRIDVIHSHRCKENLLAVFLAKRLGSPPVLSTVHGLAESPSGFNMRSLAVAYLDRLVLRRFFSHVVGVSHDIARSLKETYGIDPKFLTVIHNGVPFSPAPPGDSNGRPAPRKPRVPHIGTVGRLVPVKDYPLFLATAAEIRRRLWPARFTIVGDGPLRDELLRLSRELQLDDCVHFVRFQPDLTAFYDTLDLYLSTSLHEGIPMSVLEAMARGVPVVAPRVGGLPEILASDHADNLIAGRDPTTWASRCLDLLTDDGLRSGASHTSQETVRTCFSIRRTAEAYVSLYRSLNQPGLERSACSTPPPKGNQPESSTTCLDH